LASYKFYSLRFDSDKHHYENVKFQADKSRLFVSVPRWRQGVPSTLNYVPLANIYNETATSPQLIPYPNLEFNRQGNCEGATSVFRMFADHCDRLWVVDTGTIGNQQVCPPQILAFDLKTDKVIYTHRFSEVFPNASVSQEFFLDIFLIF